MLTRWIVLVLLFCASTLTLSARQFPYKKTSAEVTVAGTAIALFSSSDVSGAGHPPATVGTCSLTGANIRVSYDGTDPTTSVGIILVPGQWTITGTDVMLAAKGIRDDSTSATWNCVVLGQ